MPYSKRLRAVLEPHERRLFERLSSPQKVQTYLDGLPINFELSWETYMSPRRVIREKTAHCFEGALLAAAAIAYHGGRPLLLDFRTLPIDEDHVVTLFQQNGLWGAISKTNHACLRYRDPVYKSVRELAMSFFHEYIWGEGGAKTLREVSKPFSLSRFSPDRWVTAEDDLFWLVEAVDDSPHEKLFPDAQAKFLRKAHYVEVDGVALTEWAENGTKKERTP
jgi:hypothetical protein